MGQGLLGFTASIAPTTHAGIVYAPLALVVWGCLRATCGSWPRCTRSRPCGSVVDPAVRGEDAGTAARRRHRSVSV